MNKITSLKFQKILSYLFVIINLFVAMACSQVSFRKDPANDCQGNGSESCISEKGLDSFSYSTKLTQGKVDILFINDNSASMSWEQTRLADRFSNFIQQLDSKMIDYRIAMTTTDVSSAQNPARGINLNGALQDGRLVDFGAGNYFLSSGSNSPLERVNKFNSTIRRSETLSCESFILNWRASGKSIFSTEYNSSYTANCPSGDERGIYASILTTKSNPSGFIRAEGNLVYIFLSDEDVRSQLYSPYGAGFELDSQDRPEALISEVKNQFSQKSFTAHAIVTTSADCLNQQNNQLSGVISGSYGLVYHELAQKTQGKTINICNSDYTSQLGVIAEDIIKKSRDIILKCSAPIEVSVNPSNLSYVRNGRVLTFSENTPSNVDIQIQETCASL